MPRLAGKVAWPAPESATVPRDVDPPMCETSAGTAWQVSHLKAALNLTPAAVWPVRWAWCAPVRSWATAPVRRCEMASGGADQVGWVATAYPAFAAGVVAPWQKEQLVCQLVQPFEPWQALQDGPMPPP